MGINDFVMDSIPIPTTPEEGFEMTMESVLNASVGKKDSLKDQTTFNAIVLGDKVSPTPFTPREMTAMFGITISSADNADKYYGYRVRVTDLHSPHAFYPIPCDPNKPSHFNTVSRNMHTLILAKEGQLSVGDTVRIHLNKRGGKYDLSYGYFMERTGRDSGWFTQVNRENPYRKSECSSTGALFNSKVRTLAGGSIGSGFVTKPVGTIEKGRYKDWPYYGATSPTNPFGLRPYAEGKAVEQYEYIVVHITDGSTAKGAVTTLGTRGFSYHYLIEPNGKVIKALDPNAHAARHGGTNESNAKAIGISLVNTYDHATPGTKKLFGGATYTVPEKSAWHKSTRTADAGTLYEPFPAKQVDAMIGLIKSLKSNKRPDSKTSNIKYITGHENIKGDKGDPGPGFDPHWDKVISQTGLTAHPSYGIK